MSEQEQINKLAKIFNSYMDDHRDENDGEALAELAIANGYFLRLPEPEKKECAHEWHTYSFHKHCHICGLQISIPDGKVLKKPPAGIVWPEKTEYDPDLKDCVCEENSEIYGRNEAIDQCKQAYEDFINSQAHIKPHACKCRNGQEGAMTVRRLDEGLFECPRCGGIIVSKAEVGGEVGLDKAMQEFGSLMKSHIGMKIGRGLSRHDSERLREIIDEGYIYARNTIQSKFKPVDVPSVEEIRKAIDRASNTWEVRNEALIIAQSIHDLLTGKNK